jgi:diacylglycerol kinase (ATP)
MARSLRHRSWRIAGNLSASFRYAAQGLGYAFATQRNFRIHVLIGSVVFALAGWLQLDLIRLAVLVLTGDSRSGVGTAEHGYGSGCRPRHR